MTSASWYKGYNGYRGIVRGKTRIGLAWIFAAALVLSARDYPKSPGILLCFAGATLRYWASGYLRKDKRPAIGGPYAHVRNPLYLGTYLMAVGTAWSIQNWWFLGVVTLLFAGIYHFIILDEEIKLREIFGEPYRLYCSSVPRFFPRPMPAPAEILSRVNPEAEHRVFSRELAAKNKAYESYLTLVALIGFVALVAFGWKTFG